MGTVSIRPFALAVAAFLAGCGGAASGAASPARPVRTIAADEVVPPFHAVATDGTVLDSRDLVGRRPFVVLFFASWCRVCEVKLPGFQRAVARAAGGIPVLAVSLDDDDTWGDVPAFVARFGLSYPIVRGAGTELAAAYDPRSAVPFTLVVGPSGKLLEVQSGWSPGDEDRLVAALALAHEAMARAAMR